MAIACAILFGALLATTMRKRTKLPWWVPPVFAVLCAACLLGTGLGAWVADRIAGFVSAAAVLFGGELSPPALAGVLVIFLLFAVAYDVIKDHKLDKGGLFALMLLPFLFAATRGPLGSAGTTVSQAVGDGGQGLVAMLIGM